MHPNALKIEDHPFADTDSRRYSALHAMNEIIDGQKSARCPNCRGKQFIVVPDIDTEPVNYASTCDLYECAACHQKWEVAYRIIHSPMIILKSGYIG